MDPFPLFVLGLFNPSSKMTLSFMREGFVVRALGPYTLGSNCEAWGLRCNAMIEGPSVASQLKRLGSHAVLKLCESRVKVSIWKHPHKRDIMPPQGFRFMITFNHHTLQWILKSKGEGHSQNVWLGSAITQSLAPYWCPTWGFNLHF